MPPAPITRGAQIAFSCGMTILLLLTLMLPVAADSMEVASQSGTRIKIGGEIRLRAEGRYNDDFRGDRAADQTFYNLRTRIDLDAAVLDDLGARVRIQDSRRFGQTGVVDATATTFLKEAHFTWRNIGRSGINLKAGRQTLAIADQRLLGAFEWSNIGRSFDAIRLDAKPAGIPIWAFTSITVAPAQGDEFRNDQAFHGLVLSPSSKFWKSADLYTLSLIDRRNLGVGGGDQAWHTLGGHITLPIGPRLTATMQGNYQFGEDGRNDVEAWSAHGLLSWKTGADWIKAVEAEYNAASGDGERTDRTTRTFNQLFPTNHGKYGHGDYAGFRNLRSARIGLRGDVRRDVFTWGLDYFRLARDEAADDFYTVAGAARGYSAAGGRDLGSEIDATIWYRPNPRLGIMAGYSRFMIGHAVEAAIRAAGGIPRDADFGFLQATVSF